MPKTEDYSREVIAVIELRLEKLKSTIRAEAKRALSESLIEGAIMLQDRLEGAHTPTGEARVERGGISAGRHGESRPGGHVGGNMVASVSHNADRLQWRGDDLMGSFGWFKAEYESYFADQELGHGHIPAANALAYASEYAAERFVTRMTDIMHGVGVS